MSSTNHSIHHLEKLMYRVVNATSGRRVRPSSPSPRADLFTAPNSLPGGFYYRRNVLSNSNLIHGHITPTTTITTPAMIRVRGMRISREQSLRMEIKSDPLIYEL